MKITQKDLQQLIKEEIDCERGKGIIVQINIRREEAPCADCEAATAFFAKMPFEVLSYDISKKDPSRKGTFTNNLMMGLIQQEARDMVPSREAWADVVVFLLPYGPEYADWADDGVSWTNMAIFPMGMSKAWQKHLLEAIFSLLYLDLRLKPGYTRCPKRSSGSGEGQWPIGPA